MGGVETGDRRRGKWTLVRETSWYHGRLLSLFPISLYGTKLNSSDYILAPKGCEVEIKTPWRELGGAEVEVWRKAAGKWISTSIRRGDNKQNQQDGARVLEQKESCVSHGSHWHYPLSIRDMGPLGHKYKKMSEHCWMLLKPFPCS